MDLFGSTNEEKALQLFSILIGIMNLSENRQQSAQQERILQELNEKFDRLEQLVKEMNGK